MDSALPVHVVFKEKNIKVQGLFYDNNFCYFLWTEWDKREQRDITEEVVEVVKKLL